MSKSSRRRSSHKQTSTTQGIAMAAVAVVVGVILLALISSGMQQSSNGQDFTATTLQGNTVQLSDYRGQVVLVNFWATWCPPCRAEMPTIQAAYDHYGDQGFTVLAVNNGETSEQIVPFASYFRLDFPILLDTNRSVQESFGIRSYPTSIFFDGSGEMYATHTGMVTEADLVRYINDGLTRTASS